MAWCEIAYPPGTISTTTVRKQNWSVWRVEQPTLLSYTHSVWKDKISAVNASQSFFLSRIWVFMRWGSPTSLGIISSCSSSTWVPRILLEERLKGQVVTAMCKERGWGSRGVTLNCVLFFQLWFKGKTVRKTYWKWAFVSINCRNRRAWVPETPFYKLLHRCSVHLVKKWDRYLCFVFIKVMRRLWRTVSQFPEHLRYLFINARNTENKQEMLGIINTINHLLLKLHNWEMNNPCYHNINICKMTNKEMHKGGVTGQMMQTRLFETS